MGRVSVLKGLIFKGLKKEIDNKITMNKVNAQE